MKKKLLSLMLASALALGVAGGLAACNTEPEPIPEVPATGIKLDRTEMSLKPDEQKGIIATVTPDGATTNVVWTVSDPTKLKVQDGLVTALDEGNATVTATVGEYKATCTVTVGEWARFKLVGSGFDETDTWNADSAKWIMEQDATDKHAWTITVNFVENAEFKFVPCVKEDDVWHGAGWATSYGCNNTKDNATIVEGGSEVNMLGGDNIKVEKAGNYTLTLHTKSGGGVDKLTYVRNGDVTNT